MKIDIRFRNQTKGKAFQPVYLRLNHSFKGKQKRIWFKTNYTLAFNNDINKSLSKEIRYELDSCIEFVEKDFYNRIDFEPTSKWFSNTCNKYFNSSKKLGILLDDVMVTYIDKQIALDRAQNTIKDNKQSQSIINSFKEKIELADCTYSLFDDFTDYLRFEKKYAISNANRRLRFLKNILKYAKKKYTKEVPDDFRDLELLKETKAERNEKEVVYKVTFTDAELEVIDKLELENESLINARKWLIIGVNTAVRGGDLLNLSKDDFNFDIKNASLKKQQGKTKSLAYIPILPPVEKVLKDFPRKISVQKFNKYLKEICRLAGMTHIVKSKKNVNTAQGRRVKIVEDKKYTFCASHMFRRSFITKYYRKLPNQEIMKVTGHKSEREFLKYVQEVESNHQIWFDLYSKENEI